MTAVEFNYKITALEKYLEYFALKLTANQEDAKDLLQETYLKALTYREKFVHKTNLKAWMFTIMKNIFINNYRRKVKANTIIDTTDSLYYLNNSKESSNPTPDSIYHTNEIQEGIERLDKDYRRAFEMFNEGYKYKEIAEKLDLSIGTVKSRIFFSRKKLMDSLKEFRN